MKKLFLLCCLLLTGCYDMPENVTPVKNFELDRYLGRWYEVARLDHSFERGLQQVTAEYTLDDEGHVDVTNRGYSAAEGEWEEAKGKAKFVKDSDTGHLAVSFFGPFYGSYVIFELDKNGYEYAFVSGPNTDYLWFLSRTPTVDIELYEHFVETADTLGFDVSELIRVDQSPIQ